MKSGEARGASSVERAIAGPAEAVDGFGGLEKVGRYTLVAELAAGGMATVHLARFQGEAGFSRTVVVKRLHAHYAKDTDFVCMFLDEARLASRVRHPNVVPVHDVVSNKGELLLAMDYVHGVSLSTLVRAMGGRPVPLPIALALVRDLLAGLHAAHETRDRNGESMQIVHRDVSPQNLMVGEDGVARVVDFGIASATARLHTTRDGQIKGKLSYMAPEQIRGLSVDRRADVFASGIVLWQLLTGAAFASGPDESRIHFILSGRYPRPSERNSELPPTVDEVVMRALEPDAERRFESAEEMSRALAALGPPAPAYEVAAWVRAQAGPHLESRAALIRHAERASSPPVPPGHRAGDVDPTLTEHSTTRRQSSSSSEAVVPPVQAELTEFAVESTSAGALLADARFRRLRLGVLGGGAAALLVVGVASLLWWKEPAVEVPAPTLRGEETRVSAAADAGPADQGERGSASAQPAAGPPATVEREPAKPMSRPEPAESKPSVVARPTTQAKRPPDKKPPPAGNGARNCSPPYVLLEGGIKKYKSECL